MKKTILLIIMSILSIAEDYIVTVSSWGMDMYLEDSGIFIETMLCVEMANRQEVLLKYDPVPYGNKIIFENGKECDVIRVFRR